MPLHFFGSTSTVSRFGERFRDGQYSLVSFLFVVLLLTVPPPRTQPFVKVGARAPRAIWSRRHCLEPARLDVARVYRRAVVICASVEFGTSELHASIEG